MTVHILASSDKLLTVVTHSVIYSVGSVNTMVQVIREVLRNLHGGAFKGPALTKHRPNLISIFDSPKHGIHAQSVNVYLLKLSQCCIIRWTSWKRGDRKLYHLVVPSNNKKQSKKEKTHWTGWKLKDLNSDNYGKKRRKCFGAGQSNKWFPTWVPLLEPDRPLVVMNRNCT